MVFARVMAGEVGRGDIGDCLGINSNDLFFCKPQACAMKGLITDLPPVKLGL